MKIKLKTRFKIIFSHFGNDQSTLMSLRKIQPKVDPFFMKFGS